MVRIYGTDLNRFVWVNVRRLEKLIRWTVKYPFDALLYLTVGISCCFVTRNGRIGTVGNSFNPLFYYKCSAFIIFNVSEKKIETFRKYIVPRELWFKFWKIFIKAIRWKYNYITRWKYLFGLVGRKNNDTIKYHTVYRQMYNLNSK